MERIGVGLIGTGFMGKCHAMAFGAVKAVFGDVPHIDRVTLCDMDEAHTRLRANEFGFARTTTNWRDLLADPAPVIQALHRLRHGGHDVILFHILDEAEVKFPFDGMIEFDEPETHQKLQVDASSFRGDYLAEVQKFCDMYRRECFQAGIDYVGIDTSMQFDKALTGYLVSRRARG